MKDRVEEAADKLRDIRESNYKVIHVETERQPNEVLFRIFVLLTESGKRGYITMNVSNLAAYNQSFPLLDWLHERITKSVSHLIKRINQ